MLGVRACELPPESLLGRYRASGVYADCYTTRVAYPVLHPDFVEAFYDSAVFKHERLILTLFARRPSTDAQPSQLARGTLNSFAAWFVEARSPNQLLLCDFTGRTRSWLMVVTSASSGTRLYFGSAIVPLHNAETGRARMGFTFTALLGFHKLYSRVLLMAARSRLFRKFGSMSHVYRDDV